MDLKKAQERLRALVNEADGIYAARSKDERKLTDDENKRLAEIETECEGIESEIDSLKRQAKMGDRAKAAEADIERLSRFEEPEERPVTESRTDFNQWPVEEADQFFRAAMTFQNSRQLPSNMNEELRDTLSAVIEKRAPTGHGTLIDQDGAFLVPSTISSTILQKSHSEGQLLSRVQNVPITVGNTATWNAIQENSRVSGSRYGGITVGRVGEAGSPTASQAVFERIKLELKKLAALVYVTEEQMEDGPQLLTVINDLVPAAIRFDVEDEIFNSNGGAEMEGILNSPSLVTVSKETGQAAATILFENIVNMWARMYAPSRSSAVWFINQDVEPQLYTMSLAVGTGGVPVYMPAGGASGSPFGTLFGRPVVPLEHCATLGTVGDIVLADMSQYLYATKGGIKTAQSMHVKFVEGETALRFTLRNDGKSWWPSAMTPASGSGNTLSPFVALATRS